MTKAFTGTADNGTEITFELPARYAVCDRCEGHGTHLHPAIGEHAYTPEDFAESLDDEGREEYFRHGGIYDVQCEKCHGTRVVAEVDEEACKTQSLRNRLCLVEQWSRSDADYRRECAAERRTGA